MLFIATRHRSIYVYMEKSVAHQIMRFKRKTEGFFFLIKQIYLFIIYSSLYVIIKLRSIVFSAKIWKKKCQKWNIIIVTFENLFLVHSLYVPDIFCVTQMNIH